jgi:hypothetical protein
MLKKKTTIVRQWILRLICVAAMSFLVIRFQGDLPLRAALGQSQEGPPVVITDVDTDAHYGATGQSHNQKVVANAYGIFMTHIHERQCCDILNSCADEPPAKCPDANLIATWRLSRSVDGGASFTTVYEGRHGTSPPAIETDWQGNIYLAHADWFRGGQNAYVLRFLASDNFQNPTSTTLTGGVGAKYAMEIDEVRGQLYFFSNSNKFFRVRLSDLAVLAEYQLTRNGDNANMHYPHLYLDDNGHLYVAWTSVRINPALEGQDQCGNSNLQNPYWSIHFMRSLDGGVTWMKPNGQILTTPISADETGDSPTDEITLPVERCVNTWLSTFLVKGDKVHFVYQAEGPNPIEHYVRYDLATSHIDRNLAPFEGDGVPIKNLDGVCSTRRSIKEIFCVSKTDNLNTNSRIVVLKSEDNGLTWHKHALGPIVADTYAVGGSPQVTDDGYIIGSYTENPHSPQPTAKFYKVASLAEPSRKDVVFTAGDLEFTGTTLDYNEFTGAATAHSPTYVVGQDGLDHVRHYIGYSYADPNGGNKAQFLQFNNLVVGKQYTFYVQPSSIVADGNCFYATAESGAVIFEGGCKGWLGNPINRIRDAWKVVFNATAPSAKIRLGNYYDGSNSENRSRYFYFDAIYSPIGDLELSGNALIDTNELTGAARAASPTYVFGQGDPSYLRHYIGYSFGDPGDGSTKAQYIQLTNLTVGKNYTVDVYPSGHYGDGNCYYAEAVSGGTVISGGCMGWLTIGQFQSITDRWRIVARADSQTMTLRLTNNRDQNNSNWMSQIIYIDAITVQWN